MVRMVNGMCILCYLVTSHSALSSEVHLPMESTQPSAFLNKLHSLFSPAQNAQFIPVTFDDCDIPLVETKIEGKSYPLMLDLGSYSQMKLKGKILKRVNKRPYGLAKFGDVRGNHYESQKYLIPEVKIGNHLFAEVIAVEENSEFVRNTENWDPSEDPPAESNGAIGRSLLKRKNIFLDFPHSRIAFVEDANLPQGLSSSIEDMLAVPFKMTTCGVVLRVKTDLGEKRFLLDSGFTKSVIRPPQCQDWECQQDEYGDKYFNNLQFLIGGKDFGSFPLYLLDITPEIEVDGILGMSFLRHHAVYIDFRNRVIYFENPI